MANNFPQWPVYTAADPEFFTIKYNDIDVLGYARKRASFWCNLESTIISSLPEYREIQTKLQGEFELKMKELGRVPLFGHVILSKEGLDRAVQKEIDPIFYMPIETVYKNIRYKLAVVYGQYGESPHEKKAIEQLEKVDATVFMGVAAN